MTDSSSMELLSNADAESTLSKIKIKSCIRFAKPLLVAALLDDDRIRYGFMVTADGAGFICFEQRHRAQPAAVIRLKSSPLRVVIFVNAFRRIHCSRRAVPDELNSSRRGGTGMT